jgi:ClpP class serine protease
MKVLNEDDTIEINPDYVEPSHADSDDDSDDDYQDDCDAKSIIAKAFNSSVPKRAMHVVKKHKTKFTLALVAFAFRRELFQALLHLIGTPKIDPATGKELMQRQLSISPTVILKLTMFLYVMIQWQRGNTAGALAGAILAGPNGVLLTRLMTRLLHQDTAYIPPIEQHWTFERINERYDKDVGAYRKAMTTFGSRTLEAAPTLHSVLDGIIKTVPLGVAANGTAILLDMTGLDESVSTLSVIRDQVSFLIHTHRWRRDVNAKISMAPTDTTLASENTNTTTENTTTATNNSSTSTNETMAQPSNTPGPLPELEIIVLLESSGGEVGAYGMAAEQIQRLRNEPGMTVTICVDRVAASGGYMMACCASEGRLFAAPFAVLGSIGVFGSIVNIHNALERLGVQPVVLKAGKNKAPLGMLGPVTAEGKANIQSMLDKTHIAFKRHVLTSRPNLTNTIDDIATGDIWLGCDALDIGLVDRLVSSDKYIGERMENNVRVLKLVKNVPKWRFGSPAASRFPFATLMRQGCHALIDQLQQALVAEGGSSASWVKSHAVTNIQAKASQW